jgi:tRNA threonylcarbamoyladenosine biosynthesis protein TsaB
MDLALDTSSAIAVALVDGDHAVGGASMYAPRSHAEFLTPMVEGVLAEAGVSGGDVARIVVGTGPAPFTGLRVGLVTARTLAFAWGVPVLGCCSLDALGAEHGGRATVVADARRREVYWATYEDGVRLGGPHVTPPGEVEVVGEVIGRGAALYAEVFGEPGPGVPMDPDPAWLVRVVSRLEGSGETEFSTKPLYLRRPDVHGKAGA